MIIDDIEQRSLEWYRARFGFFTGSEIYKLMGASRKKDEIFSDTAKGYIYQVAAERMFNPVFLNDDDIFQDYIDTTSFTTKAIRWGVEQEDSARKLYAQMNGDVEIFQVSSCPHDSIAHFAASPDGIVRGGEMRVIEIKCPSLSTHMRYLAEVKDADSLKKVKPEYYWQVMAEMSCTGTNEADFISYCAWLSDPIHVVTIQRNDDDISQLEERVRLANTFIKETFKL